MLPKAEGFKVWRFKRGNPARQTHSTVTQGRHGVGTVEEVLDYYLEREWASEGDVLVVASLGSSDMNLAHLFEIKRRLPITPPLEAVPLS